VDKRQLIANAAGRSALTREQTGEALHAILDAIAEALASGDRVALSNFGRFEMQRYPARKLRRFDGLGHYKVDDRLVPVFRSSAALRRRLREGE
jgi:DNA-binding protein HU-beta